MDKCWDRLYWWYYNSVLLKITKEVSPNNLGQKLRLNIYQV